MEGSLPEVSSTLSIRTDSGLQSSLGGLKREGPSVGICTSDPAPSFTVEGKLRIRHNCSHVVAFLVQSLSWLRGRVRTNSRSTIYQAKISPVDIEPARREGDPASDS